MSHNVLKCLICPLLAAAAFCQQPIAMPEHAGENESDDFAPPFPGRFTTVPGPPHITAASRTPLETWPSEQDRHTPVAGVISAARLRHKIPGKALREMRREAKAHSKGDIQGSIMHLQAALKIDPECIEAHNNLGARYMTLGRFHEASAEFQKALELDPAATDALLNWAGALCVLGRYDEAEDAARRVLAREPGLPRAEYVLGLILMSAKKYSQECLRAFDLAAPEHPKAREFAARVRQRLQPAGR